MIFTYSKEWIEVDGLHQNTYGLFAIKNNKLYPFITYKIVNEEK